jgi:hypothetical protein
MGIFQTTLRFESDYKADVKMNTVSIAIGKRIRDNLTVRTGMGAITDGELEPETGAGHDVLPGGIASVGLEYHALAGSGYTPFVDVSIFLGFSLTETKNRIKDKKANYFASDVRLGARAGWTLIRFIYPYLAARVFGGPVHWKLDDNSVTGSDIHHYQLATGVAAQLGRLVAFAEWAGLGEQNLSAGLSVAF